ILPRLGEDLFLTDTAASLPSRRFATVRKTSRLSSAAASARATTRMRRASRSARTRRSRITARKSRRSPGLRRTSSTRSHSRELARARLWRARERVGEEPGGARRGRRARRRRSGGARGTLTAPARAVAESARRGRLLRHRRPSHRGDRPGAERLAGPAAPYGRRLLAECRVRERLQRFVQGRKLARDAQELLTRVEMAVQRVHLVAQPVEPLEQRIELPVGDVLAIHGAQFRPTSSDRVSTTTASS